MPNTLALLELVASANTPAPTQQHEVQIVTAPPPPADGPDPLSVLALVVGIVGSLVSWGLSDSKSKGRSLATEAHLIERVAKAETAAANVEAKATAHAVAVEAKLEVATLTARADTKAVDERVRTLEATVAATTPKLDAITIALANKADAAAVAAVGKSVDQLRDDVLSRLQSLDALVTTAIRDNVPRSPKR